MSTTKAATGTALFYWWNAKMADHPWGPWEILHDHTVRDISLGANPYSWLSATTDLPGTYHRLEIVRDGILISAAEIQRGV